MKITPPPAKLRSITIRHGSAMTAEEFVALIEALLVEADKGVPTVRELIEGRKRIVAAIRDALSFPCVNKAR